MVYLLPVAFGELLVKITLIRDVSSKLAVQDESQI